jgi:hypothetical protein
MKLVRIQSLSWLATLVSCSSAITLLEVLQSNSQLSSLNSLVNASPNVTALLASSNNFTFLAPSNDAIAAFNSQNPGVLNGSLLANVQYGLLKGGFPSLSFSNTPQFVPSNLVNASYANVTGGQTVELVLGSDGSPEIVTGNRSISTFISSVSPAQFAFLYHVNQGSRTSSASAAWSTLPIPSSRSPYPQF